MFAQTDVGDFFYVNIISRLFHKCPFLPLRINLFCVASFHFQ